jgi:hypothetical protein
MKHPQFAILAVFCLSTSALAQSAPRSADALPQWRAQRNVFDGNRPGAAVSNANQCAPGYARPIWGANSGLVGYSCTNYANGS